MVDLNKYEINFDGVEDYLKSVKVRYVTSNWTTYTFIFHVRDYKIVVDEVHFSGTKYDLEIYKDSYQEEGGPDWGIIQRMHDADAEYIIGLLMKFKEHEEFLKSLETFNS